MKMPIFSSVKMSGYDLVGMPPKLAVESDIFPNSSDMILPGETLHEYSPSSISLRTPMSLSAVSMMVFVMLESGMVQHSR